MNIKIKKLHPNAITPTYATDGSACFDLCALIKTNNSLTVALAEPRVFGTGLSFEIPRGYAMLIFSRSGDGFKRNVRLANCVGVIDSDYRGEVMVKLSNDGSGWSDYSHGDRIAQAMIIPVPKVTFTEVDELSDTARGVGGFGSTGK